MRRALRLARALSCTLALLCASSALRAEERRRVVLLEPAASDDAYREVLTRVRGEVSAAGFDVITLPTAPGADPKEAVESAGHELYPVSVLLVEQRSQGEGADLWIADRMLRKTFVLRLRTAPHDRSQEAGRIAVQAVELVKARLAELAVTRERELHGAGAVAPSPAPPPASVPDATSALHVNVTGQAGLLFAFQGASQAWTPVLRIGVTLPERTFGRLLALDLRASLAGLGGSSHVEAEHGSTSVRYAFASFDAALRFLPKLPVQPMISIGSGVVALDVAGHASAPYRARSVHLNSGLSALGVGFWLRPLPWLGAAVEGQLLDVWSKTVVRIAGQEEAELGHPLLLLSAGLVAGF